MPYGVGRTDFKNREMVTGQRGWGTDISTGTCTDSSGDGIITMNDLAGKITTVADGAAADATYTITVTNSEVAAADMAFVSVTLSSGTAANFAVKDVLCGAGTLTIVIQNSHNTAAWSNAVFVVSFFVVKALSATQLS